MGNKQQYTASLIRKVDIEVVCEYDADYDTVTIIRAYDPITDKDIQLDDNEINYCRGEACDEWMDSVRSQIANAKRAAREASGGE
jgi:glycogen debranching enzyme